METIKLHRCKQEGESPPDYLFFCPGCKFGHAVWTTKPCKPTGAQWKEVSLKPLTFSPSIVITDTRKGEPLRCHLFIRNGFVEYLGDCTHELANKRIPIVFEDLP